MFARFQRVMMVPLTKYNDLLERKPLLTKSITTGVMYGAGDVLAQYVENMQLDEKDADKNKDWFNYKRLAVFTTFGTVVGGPAFHYWYNYLNEVPAMLLQLKRSRQRGKILRSYAYLKSFGIEVILDKAKLPKTAPLGKWQNKFVKLVADQALFASAYLLVFFMGVGTMNKTAERIEILYFQPPAVTESILNGDAAEMYKKVDLRNPAVSDLVAQLEDHLSAHEHQIADYDEDTKYQYVLINKIFHKIRQVETIKEKNLNWEQIILSTWNHTKEVYAGTYFVDCLFWPPLQLINFTFVPVRLQFLFVNTVSLFWNTFLSLMANKEHK
mmetsp:Transcript_2822/g.4696  ORF Transcript_2822/g.4696 Transcript_2822/m.4696 type:complete len:327 (-) Transcript_2822:96-1076(-)